jgi:hypothetical protein
MLELQQKTTSVATCYNAIRSGGLLARTSVLYIALFHARTSGLFPAAAGKYTHRIAVPVPKQPTSDRRIMYTRCILFLLCASSSIYSLRKVRNATSWKMSHHCNVQFIL